MVTDIPASVAKKSRKSLSPLHVRKVRRASKNSPSPVYPAVFICAPSQQILLWKADLWGASNPRLNSSLDQDTVERAEWRDGKPRDAVKIPGGQSPRFRSSPSSLGGKSVLSCTNQTCNEGISNVWPQRRLRCARRKDSDCRPTPSHRVSLSISSSLTLRSPLSPLLLTYVQTRTHNHFYVVFKIPIMP